ncbi:retropepsin-like aspartic protease family protein [Seohaeicola zhoushanensis]|uniref:Aspartyl protease n=1 Tax=Seohaeicola zhoushanensis TaxID=1569283 RepID=A0A8J3GVR3_9RHOB|nr:TIGR02281 family clan AA aspartic protease [Seohaeicola zhoushanensis]GHF41918.1 aspartyl protease [Seohaeicola zhoushanensis]
MSSEDTGRLIYLVILACVVGFWFFVQNRDSLNKKLQQASVWGLIFVGTIAGFGLWGDIRQNSAYIASVDAEAGSITVPRARDGHYYLTLKLNDKPVRFVIDTGASDMVLRREDAEAAGIDLAAISFHRSAMTANGAVRVAPVTLDSVAIGDITDRNVRASVNDGVMDSSLLGMSYLQRYSRIEIAGGKLVLTR